MPSCCSQWYFGREPPAKRGFGCVWVPACLCDKNCPPFTLCCALVLHIYKRFSGPSAQGNGIEQRQSSIKRAVSFVWLLLSPLLGYHVKQTHACSSDIVYEAKLCVWELNHFCTSVPVQDAGLVTICIFKVVVIDDNSMERIKLLKDTIKLNL